MNRDGVRGWSPFNICVRARTETDACNYRHILICMCVYYTVGDVEPVVDEHVVSTSSTPLLLSSGMVLSLLTSLLKGIG